MTNKEAIEVLKKIHDSYDTFPKMLRKLPGAEERVEENVEAIEIAIAILTSYERKKGLKKYLHEHIDKVPEELRWKWSCQFMNEQMEVLESLSVEERIKLLDKVLYDERMKLPTMAEYAAGKRAK